MIEYLLHDRVTILTMEAGTPDRYNRPVLTEVARKTYRAKVVDKATVEKTSDRDTTTNDFMVILPRSAKITATDRVLWEGDLYEVVGRPEVKRRGPSVHHLEAIIRRVEG